MGGVHNTVPEDERVTRRHQVNTILRWVGKATLICKKYRRLQFNTTRGHNPFLSEMEKLAKWVDCGDYDWQRAKDQVNDRCKQLARTRNPMASLKEDLRPSHGSKRQGQLNDKLLPLRNGDRGSVLPAAPRSTKKLQKAALSALGIFQGIARTSHLRLSAKRLGPPKTGQKSVAASTHPTKAPKTHAALPEESNTSPLPSASVRRKNAKPQLPIEDSASEEEFLLTPPRVLDRPRKHGNSFSSLTETNTNSPSEEAFQAGQGAERKHKRKFDEPANFPRATKVQSDIAGQHTASPSREHRHPHREISKSPPIVISSSPTSQSSPVEQSCRMVPPKRTLSDQLSKDVWRQGASKRTPSGHPRERRRGRVDDSALEGLRDKQRKESQAVETSSPVRTNVKKSGSPWAATWLKGNDETRSPKQGVRAKAPIIDLTEDD